MKFPAWVGFVARRYFFAKRKDKSVASSILSVAGLALGTATLIVAMAVMNGFQSGFIRSIMEISSYHVRLEPKEGKAEDILESMRADDRVRAAIAFQDLQVLVKSAFGDPETLNLRAMSPDALVADPGLREALGLSGTRSAILEPGKILLGSELASALGLSTGDRLELISIALDGDEGLKPVSHEFALSGAFSSGFYEYDRSWAICSFETAASLMAAEGGEKVIGVKLKDSNADYRFIEALRKEPGSAAFEAVSWREYNRVFFGALRMEKTIIMLVICLIPLVVAVNIFHSLRRTVFEKHEEIGLLRAIGASPRDIRSVFIIEGGIIGLIGAAIGLLLGLGIACNVNQIFAFAEKAVNLALNAIRAIQDPFSREGAEFSIFSPAYFYLTEVPVKVYFPEVLFGFIFACLAGAFSAYFASKAVSGFDPQEILRYE